MPVVTLETVEESRQDLLSECTAARERAVRLLEEAGMHHDVHVRIAAYTALREIDRPGADGKLRELIQSMRSRAGNSATISVRWLLSILFVPAIVMSLTRTYGFDLRLLCGLFTLTVVIGAMIQNEASRRRAQRELIEAITALDRHTSAELAPLLPELKQLAAIQNGQTSQVRREASEMVRRVEATLREEGALPLPAPPPPNDHRALPRPARGEPGENLTPNT